MNHKNRNFFKFMLLWAGELISAIGSGLTSFGLGVYVFRQTGSAADMALVTLLGFLPSFLLSIPAGVLADRYDRRLLLDISTFVLTVAAAAVVRKGMERKMADVEVSFTKSFRQGWTAITERRGVLILILVSSVITCFMGVLQILAEPLILDFSGSTTLGIGETVCACGMLVSGLYLGVKGIRKIYE